MEVKLGYKLTEIGTIPEDWEVKTLADLAEKIMVGIASAATHAYRDSGVVLLRNQNIKNGYLDDDDVLFIDPEYEITYKNKRLKAGDLLTARTGYPGTTCIVPDRYDSAQSFTTLITRPKPTHVDSNFLCHYINSEQGQAFFEQNQIGGGQKNVNAGSLRFMPIPVPSLLEQRAIANVLSDVDDAILAMDEQIAKKRDINQGVMQELLTGRMRLPEFSGDWEVTNLGAITERIIGGGTPSRANSDYWGAEIPWVTVKDFATFNPNQTQEAITKEGLKNSASNLIPKGTLITSTRMAIGKAVIYEVDVSINQDLKAIFPKKDIDSLFLYYWFQKHAEIIEALGSGSTVMGISLHDLRSIEFLKAPLDEQQAIATFLADMDTEIATLEAEREKIVALKQGMMQELLTGKMRLL